MCGRRPPRGTGLAGWVNQAPAFKSPKIADLDGDGVNEIVVGGSVFEPDGSVRPGWTNSPGQGRTNPAILDANPALPGQAQTGAPPLEVVDAYYDQTPTSPNGGSPVVYAWEPNKAVLWQRPVVNPLNTNGSPVYNMGTPSSLSAADVDGDGQMEIVFSVFFWYYNAGYATTVFVLDARTGVVEHQFVLPIVSLASVALADVDRNGTSDIVVDGYVNGPRDGKLYVVGPTGVPLSGWPQTVPGASDTNGWGYIDPVVGDADRDGRLEILVKNRLFRFDGTQSPVWPAGVSPVSTGALAQLDGDPQLEVVTGGINQIVFWNLEHDATITSGKNCTGESNTWIGGPTNENMGKSNPVVADIDGDGRAETLGACGLAWTQPNHLSDLYSADGTSPAEAAGFPGSC